VTEEEFEQAVADALDSLPDEIAERVENVAVTIADQAPGHPERLGYYQGVPQTRRGSGYAGVLPDRITIYRAPLERLYGRDPERLRERIRHVVLHEIAHHFGISDERLREIGRY
jgi:predicted Zn-dependent protease with MMP-like domain